MNFKIDLKNIDLKNISLEDIQAKLKNVDKKTWIKLGVSVGAVVFFLVIFYAVLNPIVNKKKAQLDDMNKKKEETAKFVSDIKSKNKKIKLFQDTDLTVPGTNIKKTLIRFAIELYPEIEDNIKKLIKPARS